MLGQAHFFKEVSPLEDWLSPTAWKDGSYKTALLFFNVFLKKSRSCRLCDRFQRLPFCLLKTNFHFDPRPLNVTQSFLCFVYLSSSAQEDNTFVLQLLNLELNHCIRGKCSRITERRILNHTDYVEDTSDSRVFIVIQKLFHQFQHQFQFVS